MPRLTLFYLASELVGADAEEDIVTDPSQEGR